LRRILGAVWVAFTALSLALAAGAQSQKSEVPSRGQGILDVEVVDEAGQPLKDALVSVPGYRSTTGLAGTCRFGLLPGRYAVLISKDGYRGRRVNAGVRLGETTTTRVKLQKLPPARRPKN
jgi:uncharacterized membrane protein